jgi:hypothetical protein
MGNFKDISGYKFGMLTAIEPIRAAKDNGSIIWKCICDCGNISEIIGTNLRKGQTRSCGCMARVYPKGFACINGRATPEYHAYWNAKDRCTNTKSKVYHYYGGRGIQFKFESFTQFVETLGRRPSKLHSLDRIDVNGNYEPNNCRWATKSTQIENRREVKAIETYTTEELLKEVVRRGVITFS